MVIRSDQHAWGLDGAIQRLLYLLLGALRFGIRQTMPNVFPSQNHDPIVESKTKLDYDQETLRHTAAQLRILNSAKTNAPILGFYSTTYYCNRRTPKILITTPPPFGWRPCTVTQSRTDCIRIRLRSHTHLGGRAHSAARAKMR